MNYYKTYYNVISDENWNTYPDEENVRIFFYDNETRQVSAPSDRGITMEDVGEKEWEKIEKAIHNCLHPDGGIDWIVIGEGEHDSVITTK